VLCSDDSGGGWVSGIFDICPVRFGEFDLCINNPGAFASGVIMGHISDKKR
jgi:hypothetical protein